MSMQAELLVLVPRITPRIEYIFDWIIFSDLSTECRLTEDENVFIAYSGPKFQYGGQPAQPGSLFWPAGSLLFEDGIKPQLLDRSLEKVILKSESNDSSRFFSDPFADCFYLLSRYEEYLPYKADQFGCFPSESSVLDTKRLLQFPIADFLKLDIRRQLQMRFPELDFRKQKFRATITIDIDQAFAYRSKTFINRMGSLVKAGLEEPGRFKEELDVISGKRPDPFDVYDLMLLDQRKNLPIVFFLLCSSQHTNYDHQVSIESAVFRKLVEKLEANAVIAIHPSFYSSTDKKKLQQELDILNGMLNEPVFRSRQHYLRIQLPESYRNLLSVGITEDYSMGYSEQPGFRAGTCEPFEWYDLQKESKTPLRIFPISFLEISFKEHEEKDIEGAWTRMRGILETVKEFSGHLIPVWHNHTVAHWGKYKDWSINYKRMVQWIQENSNAE